MIVISPRVMTYFQISALQKSRSICFCKQARLIGTVQSLISFEPQNCTGRPIILEVPQGAKYFIVSVIHIPFHMVAGQSVNYAFTEMYGSDLVDKQLSHFGKREEMFHCILYSHSSVFLWPLGQLLLSVIQYYQFLCWVVCLQLLLCKSPLYSRYEFFV